MEQIKVKLSGDWLMVNNPQTVNSRSEAQKGIAELTGKRKRTPADEEELLRRKWHAALYFDPKLGPFLPGIAIWRSIQDGAKLTRKGTHWDRGAVIEQDRVAIEYTGPRDPDKMYAKGTEFVDIRDASPTGKRIIACRPKFHNWVMHASFLVEPTQIDPEEVAQLGTTAGQFIGIGTYRQRYGRYAFEVLS